MTDLPHVIGLVSKVEGQRVIRGNPSERGRRTVPQVQELLLRFCAEDGKRLECPRLTFEKRHFLKPRISMAGAGALRNVGKGGRPERGGRWEGGKHSLIHCRQNEQGVGKHIVGSRGDALTLPRTMPSPAPEKYEGALSFFGMRELQPETRCKC